MPVEGPDSKLGIPSSVTPSKKEGARKGKFGRRKTTSAPGTDKKKDLSGKKRGLFHRSKKPIEAFSVKKTDSFSSAERKESPFNSRQLEFQGTIDKNDSRFAMTFEMIKAVLTDKPEPSKSNSDIEATWEQDRHRSKYFALKTTYQDGSLTETQTPIDRLQDIIHQLSPSDPEALKLRLSSLCSQIYFNPLASLLHEATLETLADYGFCTLPPEHEEQCVLALKKEEIEANIVIHSNKLAIMPQQGDDPYEIPCPVTAKAVISIPINDPHNCSLIKLQLNIKPE
ncbi:hypothetical protein [Endozoicomonas sp. OPT23]|uniref:hypothetical protein n=1 Tax=Endozoicomonas sp. OPT23 TaxID=2072845 RepID=UPI00129BEEE6|nr:hypothetical protein [Endozoicomonas sp. OPT23]